MHDINSTMFFKAKFTVKIDNPTGDIDLLWKIVLFIREWITAKYNYNNSKVIDSDIKSWSAFKRGGRFFDMGEKNRIYAESCYYRPTNNPVHVSWACQIKENQYEKGFAPREWITEIGYQAKSYSEAEISYLVTYNDFAGFIGFCKDVPQMNVPRVVRAILGAKDISCFIGDKQIGLEPIELYPGDFPDFKDFLLDSNRKVPVVYISPRNQLYDGTEAELLISPEELAKSVAGNAIVFYSKDIEFSKEMSYCWDNEYTCSGGAIRLYKTNINSEAPNESARHRFLSAAFIEEYGKDCVLNIFRKALAQDVYYYETMFRLDKCRKLKDDDERNIKITDIINNKDGEVSTAWEMALEESDKRKKLEHELNDYSDENSRLREDIYNYKAQIESLLPMAQCCSSLQSSMCEIRDIKDFPDTPIKIANFFEKVFSDRITFTDRAYKALLECQTRNDYLWEALYYMSTDLYDLLREDPVQAYNRFSNKTGWECTRGEGKMTHADSGLMRQYEDIYMGNTINIEAHLKNGVKESDPKFVRIYFAYEPEICDKIIIGHCGRHLENYTSQKIK